MFRVSRMPIGLLPYVTIMADACGAPPPAPNYLCGRLRLMWLHQWGRATAAGADDGGRQ